MSTNVLDGVDLTYTCIDTALGLCEMSASVKWKGNGAAIFCCRLSRNDALKTPGSSQRTALAPVSLSILQLTVRLPSNDRALSGRGETMYKSPCRRWQITRTSTKTNDPAQAPAGPKKSRNDRRTHLVRHERREFPDLLHFAQVSFRSTVHLLSRRTGESERMKTVASACLDVH